MTAKLRVSRSRGALSGVLLILLGLWGGLVPFVGPYFHYAYTPDRAWDFTAGRVWLEVLPAVGTIAGGMIMAGSRLRPVAMFGAWLAALSGAWFAVGGLLVSLVRRSTSVVQGVPVGGSTARAVEQIGFFTGLGVVIVFIAALALGRLAVVGVRDAKLAESQAAAADAAEEESREAAVPPAGVTPGTAAAEPGTPGEPSRVSAGPAASAAATGPADRTAAGDRTALADRTEPADPTGLADRTEPADRTGLADRDETPGSATETVRPAAADQAEPTATGEDPAAREPASSTPTAS